MDLSQIDMLRKSELAPGRDELMTAPHEGIPAPGGASWLRWSWALPRSACRSTLPTMRCWWSWRWSFSAARCAATPRAWLAGGDRRRCHGRAGAVGAAAHR